MSQSEPFGERLPEIVATPPGPASRAMSARLTAVESRNVTYLGDDWPVFWEEAHGANVRDVDGNVYVDGTAAFGVALLGHTPTAIGEAITAQSGRLVHGMGDIHPPAAKVELLERLAALAPWEESRAILATGGSEAVEAALKTARLASGRPGILAFEGGYHGLTLGALATTERAHFRDGFGERLYPGVAFVPFPDAVRDHPPDGSAALAHVAESLRRGAPNGDPIGTVLVEPVQARGGARIPPAGFMSALSDLASEHGALVVADEIFTGLGRCGAPFASSRVGLRPDLICVGKALGGGMPISACLASREVMDAWPPSHGEAIHTSTFLGHPLTCACACAALDEMRRTDLSGRAEQLGNELTEALRTALDGVDGVVDVRGLGLLLGVELAGSDGRRAAGAGVVVARRALRDGVLLLPAGDEGHVVELTPPATLTTEQGQRIVEVLVSAVREGW